MPRYLLILLILWAPVASAGPGHQSDIQWWPHYSRIGPNPVIMLGFDLDAAADIRSREERAVFRGLNNRHAVYLVAPGERVRLRVQELVPLISADSPLGTQVLLRPETPLKVGKHYELFINNMEEMTLSLGDVDGFSGNKTPPGWDVVDRINATDSLAWVRKPAVHTKGNYDFGWSFTDRSSPPPPGSRFVTFDYQLPIPRGEVLVRVTLREVASGRMVRYYAALYKPRLRLGSSPPFQSPATGWQPLADDTAYEVTFDLLDTFGNELRWQGPPLAFTTRLDQ